ncbi:MAG: TetR/AcrR family transcriptional regulator [Agathobacter sp.]|nr:TetR/AcrR family transcriptional regulator [Agathobacter sp.]
MDIRIEKTEKAIKNAFMELRSKKALEKISVKELCELACINKSTFYAHYADIYALSESLEIETVNSIVNNIPKTIDYTHFNPADFSRELCISFMAHISIINILFSGNDYGRLANRIEIAIKEIIFKKYPERKTDEEYNILLSYCIHGAYHAYASNQQVPPERLISTIENIVKTLQPLY